MTIPVLIAGAGPAGMAAGCELLRLGVPVRILDSAPGRSRGTRALQLWPPALEVLRGLGLLDDAEDRGMKVRAMNYHLTGGRRLRIVLGGHNEPLLLPQEQTNLLLEEELTRLGGKIERHTKVTGVAVRGDRVDVTAEGPAGTERITAEWLIAADGVRSTVRDRLGIDFTGDRVPLTFILAEGRIEGTYERGAVHYFLGRTGSLVFAPMAGGNVRVSAAVPADTPLTPESVQALLDERGPGGMTLTRVDSLRTFTSSERIAAPMRMGRAFLVGDAAHTHSPIGGQGLNLGLQDVHNLAWKLAGVVGGTLDASVLDSYEAERRAAAEQVLRTTHQLIRMFTLSPAASRARDLAWHGLDTTGVLRRWFVPLLAGWRVRYPETFGDEAAHRAPASKATLLSWGTGRLPRPGARTPHWVPKSPPGHVGTRLRLVTSGGAGGELTRRAGRLAARHETLLRHDHLSRKGAGFMLLRPDGYVVASGTGLRELDRIGPLVDRLTTTGSEKQ
ncbi:MULTISPECIES: FAD-dependent oxidoreductase [unclassified Streptomyces]|uniref:FAD-dependent oxidoreductase n=1 Tax=unclassified Streptomyces TaxID=2593676 RepID=UPI0036F87C9D